MKLSEKRKQAIYSAVHERMMTARIEIARHGMMTGTPLGRWVDDVVAWATDGAAAAAVKAAEVKP